MPETIPTYEQAKTRLSPQQKVGQLFMPAIFINDSEEEIQRMEHLIHKLDIGSICFFHSRASAATNFEGKKEVIFNENSYNRLKELISRYQKAAKFPLLIAMDAEWGLAMRIENTPQYPYALTLGALRSKNELIYEVGKAIGEDFNKAGIHWNLAPVVDINNNPENPVIGYRSFGDNKEKVRSKASAFLKGMSSTGILNSLKHFPGHGDTATDSHLGLPVIQKSKESLLENELYPFKALIKEGVDSVMVGHLAIPALDAADKPATVSHNIITGLLRNELGYNGVIISDALNMHAVSKNYPEKGALEAEAFAAGMDVLCFSENPEEGIDLISKGNSIQRIEESFKRFWKLKEKAFSNDTPIINNTLESNIELNMAIAANTVTELKIDPKLISTLKSDDFLNLSVENNSENTFSKKIEDAFGQRHYTLQTHAVSQIKELLEKYERVVLALFPPLVKPKNKFGLSQKVIDLISEISVQKDLLIYLFGNPYALDVLGLHPDCSIVMVYQDFMEFQKVAFQHFSGEIDAVGKLPIKLKTIS